MPKNNLAGQLATFFVHLYIKLTIFSHNSEEKKWASGQKTRKPLRHKAFSLASFEIKVGKKWANGQFFTNFPSVHGYPTSKFSQNPNPKWANGQFYRPKVASKMTCY